MWEEAGPQDVSNLLWAFATTVFKDDRTLHQICSRGGAIIAEFAPQALANTAWAVAILGVCDLPMLEVLAEEMISKMVKFTPQALANSAWAWATMEVKSQELFDSLALHAVARMPQFTPRDQAHLYWAFATMQLRYRMLNDAVCRAALDTSTHYGPQEIGSLVWCLAMLRVIDTQVLGALFTQINFCVQGLGTRELGVLVDTLPALRRLLLPRLQDKAVTGASEMKKAANLDTLQTITFGAIGSCELLAHCHIAASCGSAVPSKKRQLSFKNVLCVIEYALDSCQGSLQRRNKGTVGTPSVNPGGTGGITWDRVDRTACAEFRALAAMEKLLESQMPLNQTSKTGKTGKMTIAVSEPPCVSCLAAMVKFSQGYPEIQIEVCIDGSLLRFGTEVGRFKAFSELEDGGDATEPVE